MRNEPEQQHVGLKVELWEDLWHFREHKDRHSELSGMPIVLDWEFVHLRNISNIFLIDYKKGELRIETS